MTEYEMQNEIIEKLKKWDKHSIITKEIPHGERCVDIVLVQDTVKLGIELKLTDWRKAIEQSKKDSKAFEHNYIAMPKPIMGWSQEFIDLLIENNIGLLEVRLENDFPFRVIHQQVYEDHSDIFGNMHRKLLEHFINLIIKENYFKNDFTVKRDYTKKGKRKSSWL